MDYTVKVKITPSNPSEPDVLYTSSSWTGEFVSRKDRVQHVKIEEQVKAYLLKNIKAKNPELTFDIKVLKIERCNKKFIEVEDKV